MRKCLVIILLLLSTSAFSQRLMLLPQLSNQLDSSFYDASILLGIEGNVGYRSNAIENGMVDKLLFGGFIEDELIARQYDRMNNYGRLGAQALGSFTFQMMSDSLFGKADWGWQGHLQSRYHLETYFNGGLFQAVFQGNGGEDELIQAVDGSLDYMAFQKFGVGVFHKPTMSGFIISAVNGEQFERFTNRNATLYTSAANDSLALEHSIFWGTSDTSTTGFLSGDGIGIALDGVLNVPLKESRGLVSIAVTDFGFVSWNESTLVRRSTDTWDYTGFDINEVLDESVDTVLPSYPDTLDASGEKGKETRWLPGRVDVGLLHEIKDNDFFEISMGFRPVEAYDPYFRAGYLYQFNGNTLVGIHAATGGYGSTRFGISAEKWIGKHWFAALQTEDVFGLISKRGLGMQGSVRLMYLIR